MLPCRGATPFLNTHLYQNIISIHLPGLHVLIGSTFDIRFTPMNLETVIGARARGADRPSKRCLRPLIASGGSELLH